MIDKTIFKRYFGSRLRKKLDESLIPFNNKLEIGSEIYHSKESFLESLYNQLSDKVYQPDLVRDYLIQDKHNKVSRIIPVFTKKDMCVYFYCIKSIEKYLCKGRVPGTYGMRTLNNGMRSMENQELEEEIISPIAYGDHSYNPFARRKHRNRYQKELFEASQQYEGCIFFDIANFYDSIRIDILENKIRETLYSDGSLDTFLEDEIDVLFYFLKFWNRKLEGYRIKTVGIPQDEVGDCSRILANFYLQSYDKYIKQKCEEKGYKYIRYADDQVIFCNDLKIGSKILFEASKELSKIGLNINSSKVKEFCDMDNFRQMKGFDIFELMTEPETTINTKKAIEKYFQRYNEKDFEKYKVLRRLINSKRIKDIDDIELKHKIYAEFLKKIDIPLIANSFYMYKLYNLLDSTEEKNRLIVIFNDLIDEVHFNSFHYNLLAFYKKISYSDMDSRIKSRIQELRIT